MILASIFTYIDRKLTCYFLNFFQKMFCWDVSISENEVKTQWMVKATLNYRNFTSKNKKRVRPCYVQKDIWERLMEHCRSVESIRKSEINSQNHRVGRETVVGSQTGGSISAGEYRKKLVSICILYKLYNKHLLLYDIYNVICFV